MAWTHPGGDAAAASELQTPRAVSTPGSASTCCFATGRQNTGDKLRRARPSAAPHQSNDTVATAAYQASLQLQPPFVGFIPLFCRRGHTPHMSSTACSSCARSYA